MRRPLVAATLMGASGILLVLVPPGTFDSDALTVATFAMGVALFAAAWVPFFVFVFYARIHGGSRSALVIEGYTAEGAQPPAPPFTPSPEKRFFHWRYATGTLPSCRVWVMRRARKGRVSVRVIMASPAAESDPTVQHAKKRLERWIERHPRRAGVPQPPSVPDKR
jgi:hypothetical protein